MHRLATAFVLGYHGCDESVAENLLSGEPFRKSTNDYDWLGSGVYFWEANPRRGLEFAEELKKASWGANIETPSVVGAIIELGLCLDTTTSAGIQQIRDAYEIYKSTCHEMKNNLPVNTSSFLRQLDCAVFNQLHQMREDLDELPVDTIRGVFTEGVEVFDGAGFLEKTHIQICVCELSNIKGVFRVPEDQLE